MPTAEIPSTLSNRERRIVLRREQTAFGLTGIVRADLQRMADHIGRLVFQKTIDDHRT